MNFEIKLFVLIIAMAKVKPNEVSDYQGEITNNNNNTSNCERFEPRSHIKRLSLIVRVNVVLDRTVVVDSD